MDFQELLLKAQPIVIETFFLSVGWLLGFACGLEVHRKKIEPYLYITVVVLWSSTATVCILWLAGIIIFK
jgi:lipid-binding SYLF domain-containing protein